MVDYPAALRLVRRRAQFMEEVSAAVNGVMAPLIGLLRDAVFSICWRIKGVETVNFNSPSQVVIAGGKKGYSPFGKWFLAHLLHETRSFKIQSRIR